MVDDFAVDDGFEDDCFEDGRGVNGVEVAVYVNEVSVVAGEEEAFFFLFEFGVGGALSVSGEGLAAGQDFFGVEAFGAGFIFAGDGGVEAAEWSDGLDGVISAEGDGDSCVEEAFPIV